MCHTREPRLPISSLRSKYACAVDCLAIAHAHLDRKQLQRTLAKPHGSFLFIIMVTRINDKTRASGRNSNLTRWSERSRKELCQVKNRRCRRQAPAWGDVRHDIPLKPPQIAPTPLQSDIIRYQYLLVAHLVGPYRAQPPISFGLAVYSFIRGTVSRGVRGLRLSDMWSVKNLQFHARLQYKIMWRAKRS